MAHSSRPASYALLLYVLLQATSVSAQTTNTTGPPPPVPWRANNTYGYPCQQHTPPLYGAASTLNSDGEKLCPFNAASPVCTTASCYFFKPDFGTDDRICPHTNCDVLITDWCTSSKAQGVFDFGCAVMLRPPFYAVESVGVGPYVDWLASQVTPSLDGNVDSNTQAPSLYVVDTAITKGGMSARPIEIKITTTNFNATVVTSFRTAIATILSCPVNYVFIISQEQTGNEYKMTLNVVGNGTAESAFTTLGGVTSLGTHADYRTVTVNSISVGTHVDRTARCYMWGNQDGLDDCEDDPVYTALLTSRVAMSGVYSVPDTELSKCAYLGCSILPDIIGSGILVTVVVLATFATFSLALSSASR